MGRGTDSRKATRGSNDSIKDTSETSTELPPQIKKLTGPTKSENSIKSESNHNLNSCYHVNNPRRYLTNERIQTIKKRVDEAIKNHKIFVIFGGYKTIRRALNERGWCEKSPTKTLKSEPYDSSSADIEDLFTSLPNPQDGESTEAHLKKCERIIIFRLLQHQTVDFYWNIKRDSATWIQSLPKSTILNRYTRSCFTSKEGLCVMLQQMHWHTEEGVAFTQFPRCYNSIYPDQMAEFIDDYRLTACMSLLKTFLEISDLRGDIAVCSCAGSLSLSAVKFSIERCQDYVQTVRHEDIDKGTRKIWDFEWESFLSNYYMFIIKKRRFLEQKDLPMVNLKSDARNILNEMMTCWPMYELDGMLNMWIIKPGNKCRGRGIHLMNNFQDILNLLTKTPEKKSRYVIQKYLEKPLLVHNTKFDIRQWFIVSSSEPLVLWMYRDSYLRFSSQTFDLSNFHESVHLTNNAVQKKYKNGERNSTLPDENMWDCHTFKTYLKQIGHASEWEDTIYPGMRQAIIGAMLASQDHMDRRSNSFELYGADFMLGPDFSPWLLEINSSPDMAPTTSVTARLCPQCLEDVIKVIIDRRDSPTADTGLFDCIYRQACPRPAAYLGLNLAIRGKRLGPRKINATPSVSDIASAGDHAPLPIPKTPEVYPALVAKSTPKSKYSGPVIADLIEELQSENDLRCTQPVNVTSPTISKREHCNRMPVQYRKASSRLKRTLRNSYPFLSPRSHPNDSKISSQVSSSLALSDNRKPKLSRDKNVRVEKLTNPDEYTIDGWRREQTHSDLYRFRRKLNPKYLQSLYGKNMSVKSKLSSDIIQNFLAVGLRLNRLETEKELRNKIKSAPKTFCPKLL